jgi:hypothetical protein
MIALIVFLILCGSKNAVQDNEVLEDKQTTMLFEDSLGVSLILAVHFCIIHQN